MLKFSAIMVLLLVLVVPSLVSAQSGGTVVGRGTIAEEVKIEDEGCVEVDHPCDWEPPLSHELRVEAREFVEVNDESSSEVALRVSSEKISWVSNNYGTQWKRKAIGCAVMCLVHAKLYHEAKQLANDNKIVFPMVDQLDKNKLEIQAVEIEIQAAQHRIDSADFNSAVKKNDLLLAEQDKLLADIASVGKCEKKTEPWACFKKRSDWRGAFAWAKTGSDQKKEAAVNACLRALTSVRSCKLGVLPNSNLGVICSGSPPMISNNNEILLGKELNLAVSIKQAFVGCYVCEPK